LTLVFGVLAKVLYFYLTLSLSFFESSNFPPEQILKVWIYLLNHHWRSY